MPKKYRRLIRVASVLMAFLLVKSSGVEWIYVKGNTMKILVFERIEIVAYILIIPLISWAIKLFFEKS